MEHYWISLYILIYITYSVIMYYSCSVIYYVYFIMKEYTCVLKIGIWKAYISLFYKTALCIVFFLPLYMSECFVILCNDNYITHIYWIMYYINALHRQFSKPCESYSVVLNYCQRFSFFLISLPFFLNSFFFFFLSSLISSFFLLFIFLKISIHSFSLSFNFFLPTYIFLLFVC